MEGTRRGAYDGLDIEEACRKHGMRRRSDPGEMDGGSRPGLGECGQGWSRSTPSEGGSLRLGVIGKGESVVELATLGLWLEGGLGRKRQRP